MIFCFTWNKPCQCKCKNDHKCEKYFTWNGSTCFCENNEYLKSIADTSVTKCDKTILVTNICSTKKTNTIAT